MQTNTTSINHLSPAFIGYLKYYKRIICHPFFFIGCLIIIEISLVLDLLKWPKHSKYLEFVTPYQFFVNLNAQWWTISHNFNFHEIHKTSIFTKKN